MSIITKVSVEQEGPGFSTKYGFSIVDATDKKCKAYSKVNFYHLDKKKLYNKDLGAAKLIELPPCTVD